MTSQQTNTLDFSADKLVVIGKTIAKIGEGITIIAELLVLEEEKENKKLQKQIDYLTAENEKLKTELDIRGNQAGYRLHDIMQLIASYFNVKRNFSVLPSQLISILMLSSF